MTQKDKQLLQLLLVDLCARLPYGVMVDYENHIYILNEIDPACKDIDYITVRIQDIERLMCARSVLIENIKPYLRPMSSMTEEECDEWAQLESDEWGINSIDWLNRKMFDYRGLIEKGFALAVTKENNPYKE